MLLLLCNYHAYLFRCCCWLSWPCSGYVIFSSLKWSYFMIQIAKLQLSDSKSLGLNWVEDFSIGSVVEGKVSDVKDFGVVVSFEKYNDVFGFVTHYQCKSFIWKFHESVIYYLSRCNTSVWCNKSFAVGGITVETGSIVRAVVLDVAKIEHLVDLSLRAAFVDILREETSKVDINKKVCVCLGV